MVGTSGSGKSSLVRAGLLPALLGGTLREAGAKWHVVLFRPGADPISSLAHAMLDAGLDEQRDQESFFRLKATLTRSRNGLVEAVRHGSSALDGNLLVVVDQFEELFRFQRSAAEAQESAVGFVKLLLAATRQTETPIYVAITMRSDYLGDWRIAGLAEAVNAGEYLIPRLTREQRRAAIEGPVAVGRARIMPRLVHRLLNDAGDDPDQLPVLQHALMRIWNCWCRISTENDPLDLTHYEQIGGVQQALLLHADEVFFELPDDRHRVVAERLFKALTERGPDNRGIRRPMTFARLCEVADASEQEVAAVVNAFRKPGCTFVMPMTEVDITPRQVIDISHESLMRIWRRLDAWVEEEAQSARIYRRLAETARLHQLQEAGLYRDPDLQIALAWRQQAQPNEAGRTVRGRVPAGCGVPRGESQIATVGARRAGKNTAARTRTGTQAGRFGTTASRFAASLGSTFADIDRHSRGSGSHGSHRLRGRIPGPTGSRPQCRAGGTEGTGGAAAGRGG